MTPTPQPSFDLINAVGHAYSLVWRYRRTFMRLLMFPLIVGLVCYGLVAVMDYEHKYLRQSILLLPAFFAEGWMIVYLVRLVFRDGEKQTPIPILHADKNMQAGIAIYVLTKYLIFGALGYLWMNFDDAVSVADTEEPSSELMAITVSIMFFGLLLFRYFWLFIPAVIGIPIKSYIYATRGFQVTLQMAGAWLVSFVPFFIAFSFVGTAVVSPYEGMTELPMLPKILLTSMQLAMELAVDIVSTASIAFGIKAIYRGEPKAED